MITEDSFTSSLASNSAITDCGKDIPSVRQYHQACRRFGVVPLSRFEKQLGQEEIRLRDCRMKANEMISVCLALSVDSHMISLDLTGSQIQAKHYEHLAALLHAKTTTRKLNLSSNKLSGPGIKIIAKLVSNNVGLQSLDLSGNGLKDEDSAVLCTIIKDGASLRDLSLKNNELSCFGSMALGDVLSDNETIESLDLSWNHLRGKGAQRIALSLQNNCTLLRLDISWNGFGHDGCVAMAQMLRNNTSLVELNMANNRIHPPGLFELVKGLVENKSLGILRLGHNPITVQATVPLLCSIRDCPSSELVLLDLSGIVVDTDFEEKLAEVRKKRPDFHVVYENSLPIHADKMKTVFDPEAVFNIDPIRILYHTKKNMRLIDLFNKIDRDSNSRLSRDEVKEALELDNYKLSSRSLDKVMTFLDENKDGEIDLGEFIKGERQLKRDQIRANALQKENLQK